MNRMKHKEKGHYLVMVVIMIFAGLLSTMNVWTEKVDHIRFHLNDIYMILLMTAWMVLFMAIYYNDTRIGIVAAVAVGFTLWAIRTQAFVTPQQYYLGMIPHHSMAIHMSKQLLQKESKVNPLVLNIIKTQEQEIELMKKLVKGTA